MIAILHNIRSLHNVGSMFRTADGAGIKKIYLTGYTPSPLDKYGEKIPQVSKVSLGAEDSVSWEKIRSLDALIKRLKKDKYKIFAVEQDKKSKPYYSSDFKKIPFSNIAILVGNEVRGLSGATLKKCDEILEIPMKGEKESLNVSVAFAIVAYSLSLGER